MEEDTLLNRVQLDRNSPAPLYLQIKQWMLGEIEAGRWPAHYKLPAEEDLARRLGVNRGTLRQAISELIALKRLTQIRGKGTFVTSDQIEQPLAENLLAFSEDLISKGIPFETQVLEQQVIQPSLRVASLLSLAPGAEVFYLKRVRTVEGTPVILLNNYVRCDQCPGITQVDFTKYRLFEALEQVCGLQLDWGRRVFEARIADAESAQLLQISEGDPLMYIEQVVYLRGGAPIEASDVWLPGERFKLSATVQRRGSAWPANNLQEYVSSTTSARTVEAAWNTVGE